MILAEVLSVARGIKNEIVSLKKCQLIWSSRFTSYSEHVYLSEELYFIDCLAFDDRVVHILIY